MGSLEIGSVGPTTASTTASRVQATAEAAFSPVETSKSVSSNAISPGQAVYFSPSFKFDPEAQVVIYVQRNTDTGDVINQYPSKKVVEEYRQSSLKGKPTLDTSYVLPNAPKVHAADPTPVKTDKPAAPAPAPVATGTVTKEAVTSVKSDV